MVTGMGGGASFLGRPVRNASAAISTAVRGFPFGRPPGCFRFFMVYSLCIYTVYFNESNK